MSHYDLAVTFALEGRYLGGEVAAGDPGSGPIGGWQRPGEHDLGKLVHEIGIVARRRRPVPGHLLVSDAAHDVRSDLAQGCDFPCAYIRMLGRKPPVSFTAGPRDEPVHGDTHLQDHWPHQNSFFRRDRAGLVPRIGLPARGSTLARRHPRVQYLYP